MNDSEMAGVTRPTKVTFDVEMELILKTAVNSLSENCGPLYTA